MKNLLAPFLLLLLLLAAPATLRAQKDTRFLPGATPSRPILWCALVHATLSPERPEPPESLKDYAEEMDATFGYNTYTIVGETSAPLDPSRPGQTLSIPSKAFSATFIVRELTPDVCKLSLQIFQRDQMIAESGLAMIPGGAPASVWGPVWGSGQLIIVARVR